MKKIIDGKKYDTETAELIYEWSSDHGKSDFAWYEESLYRKRTGEYFLYGYGHAASKYAEHSGKAGAWIPAAKIIPLPYEQARQWMEEHAEADEYGAVFGEVAEDGEDVAVTFRISSTARERLRKAAERTGRSQAAIIEELISTL